jgi:hypothetical protein
MRVHDSRRLRPRRRSVRHQNRHAITKHAQAREVSWQRMVVEVALYNRLEPLAGFGYGIVPSRAKLMLALTQLGSHVLADRCSPYREAFWVSGNGFGGKEKGGIPAGSAAPSCTSDKVPKGFPEFRRPTKCKSLEEREYPAPPTYCQTTHIPLSRFCHPAFNRRIPLQS